MTFGACQVARSGNSLWAGGGAAFTEQRIYTARAGPMGAAERGPHARPEACGGWGAYRSAFQEPPAAEDGRGVRSGRTYRPAQ